SDPARRFGGKHVAIGDEGIEEVGGVEHQQDDRDAEEQQCRADDRAGDLRLDDPSVGPGRTKRANMSSAMSSALLPKLMLSSPPIVLPVRSASWSVARRSRSASTAMARHR